jgi:hypothetical protein
MKIKVTIKAGSKSDKILKKMIADKAAFRDAVANGAVTSYVRTSGTKFTGPVSIK